MTAELNSLSLEALYSNLREAVDNSGISKFENRETTLDTNLFEQDSQEVDAEIRRRFITPSNILSWDILDLVQSVPKLGSFDIDADADAGSSRDEINYNDFLEAPGLISRTAYSFKRRGLDGHIVDHKEEVLLREVAKANSSNSLSLTRSMNYHGNTVRGSTAQLPFIPGGIMMKSATEDANSTAKSAALLHKDAQGLFDIPKDFSRGIIPQIEHEIPEESELDEFTQLNAIDNSEAVQREVTDRKNRLEDENYKEISQMIMSGNKARKSASSEEDIDALLPMDIAFGRSIHVSKDLLKKKEWAHVVDLNHKITNFEELVPNPARTWPFELDTFQKEAIYHLEQGDSVFVAAHTSAGKTVVAEYAIAMAQRNMTKTIYTSPIKALSNQKFRDFKETFDNIDVGLITGDVQINPEANCLIMTTEILRSMLYRGADLIRDVEFVIFDEVHYVNDQDRGVVWEEVIIMLPQHVKFILLSATVPNTLEFATWIGRTKQKNIYVISTPKRPVPLEINIWAKNQLIPVVSPNREFLDSNFRKHKELLSGTSGGKDSKATTAQGTRSGATRGGRGGSARGGAGRGGQRSSQRGSMRGGAVGSNKRQFFRRGGASKKTWPELVNYLRSRDLLPMVAFVFSKKRCEEYADWMEGVNFCNNREKSQIYMFIEKSITRLKKDDRELPQILKIRSLLERGIAVHHGGLLPIVKELIEILFAKGFIKVLFATETFAMGLNLPTRTVVFSEIQKHDGNSLRDLTPGEFTQMAGRAGRRGLDKMGTVIVMAYNDPLPIATFKEVTLGVPTKLQSQFRLTYNMILNLLRIEALKVEEMIKYSFSENTNQASHSSHSARIKELELQLENVKSYECPQCSDDIKEFLDATVRYKELSANIMEELSKSDYIHRILKEGRLVLITDSNENYRLGFIFRNNINEKAAVVMVFTNPNVLPSGETNHLPYNVGFSGTYLKTNFQRFEKIPFFMETVPFSSIVLITAYNLKIPLTSIMKGVPEAIQKMEREIQIILKLSFRLKETSFGGRGTIKIHQSLIERENVKEEIKLYKCLECPRLAQHIAPEYKKYKIESEIKYLYHLMSDENLNLLPDYERRLNVLKTAGFIDDKLNVLLKGRVACEINSGYELVLTELILDNFLGDFEPEEIVALLSVFVYEGRTREEEAPIITPRLVKGKKRIQEIYRQMLALYEENQVPLSQEEAEFLEKKRFAMMNVVYEWARGLSFKEIMEISPEAEGTVVRVITWLDEICREVKAASIIIGNSNLHAKMGKAQELIKRDIVFAASLYL